MDSYTNIPGQLKQRAQWVAWGIKGEPPKAPYNPTSLLSGFPQPAKAGVRETWGTFQSALQCVSNGLARGIGYEFDGQALYGVDLDSVLDGAGTLMSYITNADAGSGLIRYGSSLVPFVNKWPRGRLYKLMTTKPGEDAAFRGKS